MTIRSPLSPLGFSLVTSFGLGTLRPAPGTWGSLPPVGVAAGLIVLDFTPRSGGTSGVLDPLVFHAAMLAIVVVFSLTCLIWSTAAEAKFGRKDPSEIVADETAGMAITLMVVPVRPETELIPVLGWLVAAFLAFRVMDIIKPPPARGLQRLAGGVGVLIDDLVAGVYAGVIVLLLGWMA